MANDVIAREGSLGREMFFLVNGNVDVTAMISPLMATGLYTDYLPSGLVRSPAVETLVVLSRRIHPCPVSKPLCRRALHTRLSLCPLRRSPVPRHSIVLHPRSSSVHQTVTVC